MHEKNILRRYRLNNEYWACADSLAKSARYYRDLGLELPDTIAHWPDLLQLPAVLARNEALPDALVGAWQLRMARVMWSTRRFARLLDRANHA
jgi:hypothetical protein